jgi:hypothetical protein
MRRDPDGPAAIAIAHPDVSGIDKGEMILGNRGLAQQASLRIVRTGAGASEH